MEKSISLKIATEVPAGKTQAEPSGCRKYEASVRLHQMHSEKGNEVGRLKFLHLPPSKGKRPTLFLQEQPVERCWEATHEEHGTGFKWRSEVVELLGHNPDNCPVTVITNAECLEPYADTALILVAIVKLAAHFSSSGHIFLLKDHLIPPPSASAHGFRAVPFTDVYVLTAADAIAANAQLNASLNTLDLPRFSNDLAEAERRKLEAQVRKLNALSLRTPGGAVFQSWSWVAARKEHSDHFGDTIFDGEDYLRCKRDFMGYGDYLLSMRSGQRVFDMLFETLPMLEPVADQLTDPNYGEIEPLSKCEVPARKRFEARMGEPEFVPQADEWPKEVVALAEEIQSLPDAAEIGERDSRFGRLLCPLGLPGSKLSEQMAALLNRHPIYKKPEAVERMLREVLECYRSAQRLTLGQELLAIAMQVYKDSYGEATLRQALNTPDSMGRVGYEIVRGIARTLSFTYAPSLRKACQLLAGQPPLTEAEAFQMLQAAELVQTEQEVHLLAQMHRSHLHYLDGKFWSDESWQMWHAIGAYIRNCRKTVVITSVHALAENLKGDPARIRPLLRHVPDLKPRTGDPDGYIYISSRLKLPGIEKLLCIADGMPFKEVTDPRVLTYHSFPDDVLLELCIKLGCRQENGRLFHGGSLSPERSLNGRERQLLAVFRELHGIAHRQALRRLCEEKGIDGSFLGQQLSRSPFIRSVGRNLYTLAGIEVTPEHLEAIAEFGVDRKGNRFIRLPVTKQLAEDEVAYVQEASLGELSGSYQTEEGHDISVDRHQIRGLNWLPQAKGTGILKIAFDPVGRRADLKVEPGFAQLRIAQS